MSILTTLERTIDVGIVLKRMPQTTMMLSHIKAGDIDGAINRFNNYIPEKELLNGKMTIKGIKIVDRLINKYL